MHYNVVKFQAPFERLKEYGNSPETNLYKAIILQAVIDATSVSENKQCLKIAFEAKNWLFGNADDFLNTCALADIEVSTVRNIARELIHNQKQKQKNHLQLKTEKSKLKFRKEDEVYLDSAILA